MDAKIALVSKRELNGCQHFHSTYYYYPYII